MKEHKSLSLCLLVRPLPVVLLILIMTIASLHRVGLYQNRPGYDPGSGTGFFFTEEAFQYRYARMIAGHQPIPRHDAKAQWPEGLYPHRELTLLQEYLHGLSFRLFTNLFPNVPFHVYVIWFVSIFSTLTVAALFFGARALGVDVWTALLCAALYAFTGAAFARVRFYELECTAFPLMAGSFVLMLYGLKAESLRRLIFAAGAGCILAAALVTWHFTRFYWLAITSAYGLAFLLFGSKRGRVQVFAVMLGCVLATGMISPAMREAGLITSPSVIIGAVLLSGLYLDLRSPLSVRRRVILLSAGVALALLVSPVGGEGTAYGHVWALLKYKLACFLVKPENPARLPLSARILWHGPFNSIEPGFLIYRYGLLLPLALAGGLKLFQRVRKKGDFDALFLLTTATGFFVLNLMINRLTIFGGVFLGLLMAGLFAGRRHRLLRIILAGCVIFQAIEAWSPGQTGFLNLTGRLFPDRTKIQPFIQHKDELNMLDWVRRHTETEAVFLSNQERSPSLLTYADRAIVLHPKFETEHLRDKYIRILLTLYEDDEDAFYRLLRAYQVDYYLYPTYNLLLTDPDSERYRAGLSRVPRRSMTYRLHFHPESFSGLRLVYRNGAYQIYQVVKTGRTPPDSHHPYYPVYDETLFHPATGAADIYFNDSRAEQVMRRITHAYDMVGQAEKSADMDRREQTLALIREAVETGLPDGMVCYRAANAALTINAPQASVTLLQQAIVYDPGNTQFQKLLARVYLMIDEPDAALPLLTDLRRTIPDDPVVYNYLGIFYWQKKQYDAARDCFDQALRLDPLYTTARKNLLRLKNQFCYD